MVAAHSGRHLTRYARTRQTAASFRGDNPPMEDGMRILLVEDEPTLAATVARALEREGWVVDRVGSLAHAFGAALSADYRVILLDRRLPDGDGLRLVAVAKSRPSPASIIVLTARDEIADRIEGLDAGADDYLVKPFALGELLARLRAACRRPGGTPGAPPIEVGRLAFDPASRDVRAGGVPLAVPRRELALLELLLRRAGRVVQREHLEGALYGFAADVTANALETQVSRLRRRLQDAGADVEIRTVRGVGYLLQPC